MDYDILSDLIDASLSVEMALDEIACRSNRDIILRIKSDLKSGHKITSVFFKNPKLNKHFSFFIQKFDLSEAIKRSLTLYRVERNLLLDILNKMAYPCLIILVSSICLGFCTIYVLPSLMSILDATMIKVDYWYFICIQLINYLLFAFVIIFLLCTLAGSYFYFKNAYVEFYTILKRLHMTKLFKFIFSHYFVGYFLVLLAYESSTKHQLSLLKQMRYQYLMAEVASKLDAYLKQGESFDKALLKIEYFSDELNDIFRLGIKAGCLEFYLQRFLNESNLKLQQMIKKLLIMFKCLSYLLVGLVVILMSQLLFTPLEMLSII